MRFQDEIKNNFRDKTEVETETQKKRNEELFNSAVECIKQIKYLFLKAANNGEYEIIGDRKRLTVSWFLPPDMWTHCENKIPAQYERRMFGKVVQTVPQRIETKLYIKPEKRDEYEKYLGYLKELATAEDIEVGNCFFENRLTLKKVDAPYSHTDIIPLAAYEWLLKIESKMFVPEKYSNDTPVEIEVLEEDNSVCNLNIDQMDGHEFEYFCADILRDNGFEDVVVTQGSGDQGIDIIAQRDGVKYGIQCKCYSSEVGNKAVQEAFAGKTYYKCHIGIVLTNRYFTRAARELAESNGIILWDRDKLLSMINHSKRS